MSTFIYYLIVTVTTTTGVSISGPYDSFKTMEECEISLSELEPELQDHPDIESYGLTCVEAEAL